MEKTPVKHVFVDWSEIESGYGVVSPGYYPRNASPQGVSIRAHKPQTEREPILSADRPWEGKNLNEYNTVVKVGDEWRCYYEAFGDDCYRLCLAISRDGIHWEKPNLGVCEYKGSPDNNILVNCEGGKHGFTVLYDENAPVAEQFKMIYTTTTLAVSNVDVSPDGLHFTTVGPAFRGGDTQSTILFDTNIDKYVVYTKGNSEGLPGRRTIVRFEGDSMTSLQFTGVMLYTNPTDAPDIDYYTSAVHQWPGAPNAYIMLPAFFHHTSDLVDLRMYCSRDGKTWYRPLGDEAWIDNTEDAKSLYAGIGIIDYGNGTWSILYGENDHGHNDYISGFHSALHRAILREDGFTSLHADAYGSVFTTPLCAAGDRLIVNADFPDGAFKAEVVECQECAAFPDFSADDCTLEKIDSVHYEVRWKKPLSALSGNYRLHFIMKNADLYAYTI